jgi:hypothetical protein
MMRGILSGCVHIVGKGMLSVLKVRLMRITRLSCDNERDRLGRYLIFICIHSVRWTYF